MAVKRIEPDPYVVLELHNNYEIKLTPFTSNGLMTAELTHNTVVKLSFRISVSDLRLLATEAERLVIEKVHAMQRQQYGVAVVVRS